MGKGEIWLRWMEREGKGKGKGEGGELDSKCIEEEKGKAEMKEG